MTTIIRYLNKKAQGIVEYALLLAFIVGLGMSLNGVEIKDSVTNVFDDVATLLGGDAIKTHADAIAAWGKMNINDLLKVDNEKRVKADQETLADIGRLFIGLSESEVRNLLSGDYTRFKSNGGLFLGNYYDLNGDNTEATGIGSMYTQKNMSKTGYEALESALTAGAYNKDFTDNTTRYFYSDEMLKQMDNNNTTYGDYSKDRSVRVLFHYDDNNTVDAVRVRINRGSTDTNAVSTYSYYGQLDVTVNSDKSYKQTISNEEISNFNNANNQNAYSAGRITVGQSNSYNDSWYLK